MVWAVIGGAVAGAYFVLFCLVIAGKRTDERDRKIGRIDLTEG